jgi:type 1 glutamine amidotransferase
MAGAEDPERRILVIQLARRPIATTVILLAMISAALAAPPPMRLLVVTGGHDYPTSFYTVFEQEGLTWDHAVSNEEAFKRDLRGRYDALVLYDASATITPEAQTHFREFVENGGGLVILHHAIISYQDSDWFRDLVGGRYFLAPRGGHPPSTYLHDVDMNVRVVTPHPITRGVSLTRIHDETYKGMWIAPTSTVLLATDNATADGPLAWVSAYKPARVVYIQLGHGTEAHRDAGYRALVRNALLWVGSRLE